MSKKHSSLSAKDSNANLFSLTKSPDKNRAAWVGITLTTIGMLVTAILYVTSAIAGIEDRAYGNDKTIEAKVRKDVEETYVKKIKYTKDITILDERQQQIKDDLTEVKTMIKEMYKNKTESRRWRRTNEYE